MTTKPTEQQTMNQAIGEELRELIRVNSKILTANFIWDLSDSIIAKFDLVPKGEPVIVPLGKEVQDPTESEQTLNLFMELVSVFRQWFEDEGYDKETVNDFVVGRFASRTRDLLTQARQEERQRVVESIKAGVWDTNCLACQTNLKRLAQLEETNEKPTS